MRQRQPETEAAPLDPVALSLALWLGLMVGALGLQHMSEQAALQAAQQQPAVQQNGAAARLLPARASRAQAFTAWSH